MNKQRFDEKCMALYAYEDEMYARIKEFIEPYSEELNKYGCKVECRLLWFYPDENEDNQQLMLKRREIYYKRPYLCTMNVGIGPIDFNFEEETEESRGIALNELVAAYSLTLFRGWAFSKGKCKYIFKHLGNICDEVMKFGIENVVNKYRVK